ncbi:UNVERIFIED_CONTAM: hypothetical protein FKN15_065667 [Acipenser sinensis]
MKTGGQKMEENKEVTVSLEEERDGRRKKSPLRNRPDPNEMRNRDDKRRDDRKRRDCDRHNKNSDPYRERYDRRRGTSRGRSFSRSRSRSGSRGKSGDRDHSRAKERGFCVRGDLCPFDHGNDPLIVDDVTLPTMIPFPPPPGLPPPGLPMPPMPGMPPNLRLPIPPHGQPPPPGIFPMPEAVQDQGWSPLLLILCEICERKHFLYRCDADPSALANYVVALVKKDKPAKDLKALCADQLDVFLQKETTGFVDKLFEGLTTKNYLGNQDQLATEAAKVEMKTGGQKMEENKEVTVSLEEERDGRRKKSPLRNRPDPNEMRNRDDKRRDDRKRRDCDRHNKNSDPYRERYDRRRGTSRGRSFSRSRSRSGSRGKSGDRDHSRAKESWSNYYSKRNEGKPFSRSAAQKRRCRDYDERGFCVRGDLCPFDHGNDPLIVDDVTLPTMIPFPPPPGLPPPGLPMPPMPGMPPNLRLPIPPHGQPPPPGIFPMPGPPLIPTSAIDNREHSGASSVSTLAPTGVGPAPPLPPRPSIPPHPQYTLAESNVTFSPLLTTHVYPEAALIQYTVNEEARRAISSTEAVLNNRFIRVYWHRENNEQQLLQQQTPSQAASLVPQHANVHKVMNKLLNPGSYSLNKMKTRPGAMAVNKADPLHTGFIQTSASAEVSQGLNTSASHLKAVYSSPVMKMTSKPMAKSTKALEAHEAMKKKQETLKLQQDMRKKKQEMLEKQIECQKVLINRLEKNKNMKPEERANIMKTFKELTDKISQLKDEIKPNSSTPVKSTQPKTKIDAQKELLDAEMDFHKKLSSGEDTTDLKKKLGQLQVEAAHLGLIPAGRGKAPPVRGRGRGRGRSVRGRGVMNHMVVDHRPRALAILGVTKEEKEELMPHFVKFGEVEELHDYDATSIVVTFRTRSEAENAANQGARFKGRTLQISWYKPKTPSISTEPDEEEAKEEEVGSALLPEEEEEDDDEEDEDESRSWRR